jgi:hypothetical protein
MCGLAKSYHPPELPPSVLVVSADDGAALRAERSAGLIQMVAGVSDTGRVDGIAHEAHHVSRVVPEETAGDAMEGAADIVTSIPGEVNASRRLEALRASGPSAVVVEPAKPFELRRWASRYRERKVKGGAYIWSLTRSSAINRVARSELCRHAVDSTPGLSA